MGCERVDPRGDGRVRQRGGNLAAGCVDIAAVPTSSSMKRHTSRSEIRR